MRTIFNSLEYQFKNPIGCVKLNEILHLRVEIPIWENPEKVKVIFCEFCSRDEIHFIMEKKEEDKEKVVFESDIRFDKRNIYHYYFEIKVYGTEKRKYIKKKFDSYEGIILNENQGENWQLSVYTETRTHENMLKGVMYQIFPDRFCKFGEVDKLPTDRIYREWGEMPYFSDDLIGKDFFKGNLKGVTYRLKYLKALGVTVIYMNPIWLSESNHRYNTADYKTVDQVLGNKQDLVELINKAHEYGMIVIIDTVLNHTGSHSIYFNKDRAFDTVGAYNSKESIYYDWYYFGKYPDEYESWWGFKTLPKVNQESATYQNFMYGHQGIIAYWYSLGIDGLRIDVADELPNSSLKQLNHISKENREKIVLIYEVWEDASNKVNYGHRMEYFLGEEATSVMNYPVRDAILAYMRYRGIWANNLKETLIRIFVENYPKEIAHSLMNFLSSHDTVRAITKLAGPEVDEHDKEWQNSNDNLSRQEYIIGRKRLMISYMLLYFLPGIPSIFYGDEIGMTGQKDPFCRKCYDWNRRDKKLLRVFKKLGKFRSKYEMFLSASDFDVICINDECCIVSRYTDEETMINIINPASNDLEFDLIKDFTGINYENVEIILEIGGKITSKKSIAPYSGVILKVF